jgi:hypothetical protein
LLDKEVELGLHLLGCWSTTWPELTEPALCIEVPNFQSETQWLESIFIDRKKICGLIYLLPFYKHTHLWHPGLMHWSTVAFIYRDTIAYIFWTTTNQLPKHFHNIKLDMNLLSG